MVLYKWDICDVRVTPLSVDRTYYIDIGIQRVSSKDRPFHLVVC